MKKLNKIFIILILSTFVIFAQEELDKMPEIKGGITELAKNIKYPESSKKEGIEGKVFVKVIIDENGNVESTEVVKSVNKELDEAAISAIKLTKFIAGEKDGKFVKAEIVIPINFKLDGNKNFITSLLSLSDDSSKVQLMKEFEEVYIPAGTFVENDSIIPTAWYDNFRPFLENKIINSDILLQDSTKIWIDLGCKPNGQIEKVIYSSKLVDELKCNSKLENIILTSLESYKFPLTTDKKYSQCGTLVITKNK